ncbi:MAG: hypothetical protein KatS3mg131_3791 [Candidatus Tectimicrobiota bacterium]|nr:MAG: hypothetical protein KatS3mg131_3791 [Candidatus Tectomicrobia bacterium]
MSKLYVLLTIDTEADFRNGRVIPLSKMVYGEVGGRCYGIPLIMDLCEQYGYRATFFVSPFEARVLGEAGMRQACELIARRGHDVQLHTHPKWVTNARFMWQHPLEQQVELLDYGKRLLQAWVGRPPLAHRAGGFGADHHTLRALKSVGIPVDSSHIGSPYCRLDPHKVWRNGVQLTPEGIVELPVTQFAQFKLGRFMPTKPFDINANTLSELRFVVRAARATGLPVVTLLMHSFSFLKRSKDRSVFTPIPAEVRKFARFLRFLAEQPDVEVLTVAAWYRLYQQAPQAFATPTEVLPVSTLARSLVRACRYYNRGKGNLLLAGSSAAGTAGLGLLGWLLWRLL